jgi:hypothetical protein
MCFSERNNFFICTMSRRKTKERKKYLGQDTSIKGQVCSLVWRGSTRIDPLFHISFRRILRFFDNFREISRFFALFTSLFDEKEMAKRGRCKKRLEHHSMTQVNFTSIHYCDRKNGLTRHLDRSQCVANSSSSWRDLNLTPRVRMNHFRVSGK